MQNHNISFNVASAIFCCLLISCATTNAPTHWLSEPDQTALDAYGGWIDVRCRNSRIAGELIAISEDTVFVADSTLHAVVSTDILSARLAIYHASSMGGYVFLGVLSTLSNGGFLIFTAPMWLIGGSTAASSRSHDPIIDYPDKTLDEFTRFARYPQGLPSSLDRGAVRIKSWHR